MAEQQLIDRNADVSLYVETWTCNCSDYGVQNVMSVDDVSALPEIDPETLPIVRQLRKELVKVTAERDEIASLSGKLIVLCEQPQEWRQKLFRRHRGHMIGDYMGSGYPFVDAFDKIYVDFEETASNEAYQAVRQAAEAALKGEQHERG